MYYNWYDEATGDAAHDLARATATTVYPFVSSVDNGWLGAALLVVKNADRAAGPAGRGGSSTGCAGTPSTTPATIPGHPTVRPGGLMHGGFFPFDHDRPGGVYLGTHIGGDPVWLTTHHYDTIVSETRITSYLGILTGQVPAQHYFAPWRTFPATCDWSGTRCSRSGETRTYLGHRGLRGRLHLPRHAHRPRLGRQHVRGAHARRLRARGGLGAAQLGRQPPAARAGRARARPRSRPDYGYWGFSPSSNPAGGYREYGVDALGHEPRGLLLRPGEDQLRRRLRRAAAPATNPNPDYGTASSPRTPSFLAMMYERGQATANLAQHPDSTSTPTARAASSTRSPIDGTIARRYLSLDQAMVMGALGNVLGKDVLRRAFSTPDVEKAAAARHRHRGVRRRPRRRVTHRTASVAACCRQGPAARIAGAHGGAARHDDRGEHRDEART